MDLPVGSLNMHLMMTLGLAMRCADNDMIPGLLPKFQISESARSSCWPMFQFFLIQTKRASEPDLKPII
jgi:hypothetical protein